MEENIIEMLKEKYERKVSEFNLLVETSNNLIVMNNKHEMYESILSNIIYFLGVEYSALMIKGPNEEMDFYYKSKYKDEINKKIEKVLPKTEPLEWMEEKTSFANDNVDAKDYKFIFFREVGSFLFVPLIVNYECIGGMYFESKKKDFFIDDDIKIIDVLVNQISLFIGNENLREYYICNAETDSLTGFKNRVVFDELIGKDEIVEKYQMAYITIDNLKNLISDEEIVIGELVRMLKVSFPKSIETMYRYNRRTFVVLDNNLSIKNFYIMLEDIKKKFKQKGFMVNDAIKHYSLSIGIADFDECIVKSNLLYLLNKSKEARNYSAMMGGNNINIYTSKLELLVKSEEIIRRELVKARKYGWKVQIGYINFKLDAILGENYEPEMVNIVDEMVETTVKDSDMIFKTFDIKYLFISHEKFDMDALKKDLEEKVKKSKLGKMQCEIEVLEYNYPEDSGDFLSVLGIMPKRFYS
ncbi:MAG: GGDEF domain-containing protein [Clostridia bacterium]|jgi:GGDEF domain-containing protein|nr:GGDEF domain-containing protein [Clostridia bacterium]